MADKEVEDRPGRQCPDCGKPFEYDRLVVRLGPVLRHKACFNKVTPHERRYLIDSIGYYGKQPRVLMGVRE